MTRNMPKSVLKNPAQSILLRNMPKSVLKNPAQSILLYINARKPIRRNIKNKKMYKIKNINVIR